MIDLSVFHPNYVNLSVLNNNFMSVFTISTIKTNVLRSGYRKVKERKRRVSMSAVGGRL